MQKFKEILLDVWREACRHIEIAESTATIARMLVNHMPLAQLAVLAVDRERQGLSTTALGISVQDDWMVNARHGCSPAEWEELLAWFTERAVSQMPPPALPGALASLLPGAATQHLLAGPLVDSQGPVGVLLLRAEDGVCFEPRHKAMAEVLLEPFTAALENDRRVGEMTALREAAEADKRSLLAKLGRKDLEDPIIGGEMGLKSVMQRVELVAGLDVPVLILGETGAGKELIARAIHRRSPRSQGPVIRVNCGAIPPELIDSQLFGHERGAFTGAVEARKGWFERADGGTLFLDEIGDLPLAAQVRLLRVLQDGWLERIGGSRPIKVDVRLVAATHRDLPAMVGEGKFREDLWYRIAVFPILLPPLRERSEDIPLLARHFAEKAAVRFGLAAQLPTPEDLVLLQSYPWPGNVRELGTVIDRAALLGDGRGLEVAQALGVMPPRLASAHPSAVQPTVGPLPAGPGDIVTLDEVQRRHIARALAHTHGRIEGRHGAAGLLGINPHTLRARMRKLGVDWTEYRQAGD